LILNFFLTLLLTACSAAVVWVVPVLGQANELSHRAEEQVTFYPTYGFQQGEAWEIPMRIWVREKSGVALRMIVKAARWEIRNRAGLADLTNAQKDLYEFRTEGFIADSESNETVVFRFDKDPDNKHFKLFSDKGDSQTDRNGLIEGTLTLSFDKARQLFAAQGSTQGWLTYRAVSNGHEGVGKLRLLEPKGLSIISDIDDTVKVTDILGGESAVLSNTFFNQFKAAPCMADIYQAFGNNVGFHYVSGGPWQLYEPLAKFLFNASSAFPEGSFHMKNVRTNPFESESYQDIWRLVAEGSKQVTLEQKLAQITTLINHFPERDFILVGDSGERDPEVFHRIRLLFPDRVREIRIRDVANDQQHDPARLQNMTVIRSAMEEGVDCNRHGEPD